MALASPTSIRTATLGQKRDADTWLISDWNAGQSNVTKWASENVRYDQDGTLELVLEGPSSGDMFQGAEIQSTAKSDYGTWSWTAQAPEMVDGAVFGMFLYKADWRNDPWLEYDFEFVGGDTTKVQLNIHMEDPQGRHVSLDDVPGIEKIIDLGFDAADAYHEYEITVLETEAVFRIDGVEVGRFDSTDMPGGVWYGGELKSFVDLWAVSAGQEGWAGSWTDPGRPLVAKIGAVDIRPDDFGPDALTDAPDSVDEFIFSAPEEDTPPNHQDTETGLQNGLGDQNPSSDPAAGDISTEGDLETSYWYSHAGRHEYHESRDPDPELLALIRTMPGFEHVDHLLI